VQIIGVGAAVLGDMSTRPNWGVHELDFVFSTLVVGSLVNFALMYLLAPTGAANANGKAARGLMKLFDERWLTKMGAPGGHVFEAGYSLSGRATNLVVKATMFGVIGFAAGLAGTCISNTLIAVRKKLDPNFETKNASPNVLLNSLAWTTHMGISSNVRYQMLNGLDAVRARRLPPGLLALHACVLSSCRHERVHTCMRCPARRSAAVRAALLLRKLRAHASAPRGRPCQCAR
jgi:Protein RETICULATA-related